MAIKYFVFVVIFVLLPSLSFGALTPIARVDVVAYQRISNGATLNYGVVAFSKAGIDRIEITPSGQGYSGGTKTATRMTYNPQTDVYEYWVPISSSEFTTNGPITVSAVAYGTDGGSRTLEIIPLVVDTTGTLMQLKAWVSPTGSDTAGVVGDVAHPYQTLGKAVVALKAAGSGVSDGGIVYLNEGTYNLSATAAPVTTNEWLTISAAEGARRDYTIINSAGDDVVANGVTIKLHFKGITFQNLVAGGWICTLNRPGKVWVDGCLLMGTGQYDSLSNPVRVGDSSNTLSLVSWYTDSEFTRMDSGTSGATIVRGSYFHNMGNDPFSNSYFLVNNRVSGLDNGTTGMHSDAYQIHTAGAITPQDNIIVYGLHATDLHVTGMQLGIDGETPPNDIRTNTAFVNVFLEMREPGFPNESGQISLNSAIMEAGWDHLLIWNCSFPYGFYSKSSATSNLTNVSIVGNYFWQFVAPGVGTADGNPVVPSMANGNIYGNEVLYNHFQNVLGITGACTPTSGQVAAGATDCKSATSKAPDSGGTYTATTGSGALDMSSTVSTTYGMPVAGSALLNKFTPKTPADVYGRVWGDTADVGAIKFIADATTCDSSHLNLCTTKTPCLAAGGYWWSDSTCHSSQEVIAGSSSIRSINGELRKVNGYLIGISQ